jgi:hypothetical protein
VKCGDFSLKTIKTTFTRMPRMSTASEQKRMKFLGNKNIPAPVRRKKFTLLVSLEPDFVEENVKEVAQNIFCFFHNNGIDCGNAEIGFGKLFWSVGSWAVENAPSNLTAISEKSRQLAFSTFSTMPEAKVQVWIDDIIQKLANNIKGCEIHGTLSHKIISTL